LLIIAVKDQFLRLLRFEFHALVIKSFAGCGNLFAILRRAAPRVEEFIRFFGVAVRLARAKR
jgi:hypothetical protein